MTLLEALTATPQRETGGSTAQDRLDFQTYWGLSHLIELHEAGKSYAVAFEFHDDVIVLDNITAPSKARFFQLKTSKSGSWTLSKITQRKSDRKTKLREPSIAAKMYDSVLKFGNSAELLGFVSNQPCNFIDLDKLPCSFFEAKKTDFDAFVDTMKKEIASFDQSEARKFHYYHSSLSLSSYEDTLLGKVVNFVESQTSVVECNHKAFYLGLVDQCRRRSKELRNIKDIDELVKAKFVTDGDVKNWLSKLESNTQSRPQWSMLVEDIKDVSPLKRRKIKAEWDRYELDKITRPSLAQGKMVDEVRAYINTLPDTDESLAMLMEQSIGPLSAAADRIGQPKSDDYIRAAFLYEFYAS